MNENWIAIADSVSPRALHPSTKDNIERKVKALMETEKVFLDPEMSLQKLSSLTSTNTTYLSNTVNDCFGCNFRTLLNRYRVELAKKQMTSDGGLVKDLFKECGFSSRSAFYASFKQITGQTPLQFLKQTISDNDHYRKLLEFEYEETGFDGEKAAPETNENDVKPNKSDRLIDYKTSYTHLK